jgi:hypothetical protein
MSWQRPADIVMGKTDEISMYEEAESRAESSGDGEQVNRSSLNSQLFLICM